MAIARRLLMLLFLVPFGLYAADVAFVPGQTTVAPGAVFTLEIRGTGFPQTEGGGAEFTFDPAILQVRQVILDNIVWDIYTDAGTINNVAGRVEGITVAAFGSPGTDFTVALVEFEAVGAGQTTLVLSENPLNPWAGDGTLIYPTLVNGLVEVTIPVSRNGDLAPRGSPDGVLNVGDYLVAMRIVLGLIIPTTEEILSGDVFPVSQGDGEINLSDLILIHNAINNGP